jgi:tetratricopeptide (TPR) repeat protein
MRGRIPIRRLEQERLAALQSRERRRKSLRLLKWAAFMLVLAGIVAGLTYGLFFAPYTTLRNMLPVPKQLISVVCIVNEEERTVPAEGTLVVNPADEVEVEDVRTDGRFNWGLRLQSEQFPADQLLEGRRQIKEFWPDQDYMEPLKVVVEVVAGSQAIGRFHMVVRLRAQDWVEKARATTKLDEKVKYYEQAARLASQNALILTSLAHLYAEQGQWAKAAATYEKVAESSSTVPILKKLVGAYQQAGDTDKTIAAYLKLIQASGDDKEPFFGLINYLKSKKSPKKVTSFLAKNLNEFPDSYRPEVHAYLGELYGRQGQWKKAIAEFKKAIDGGVENPLIYLNLGEAYVRVGRYRQAEQSLKDYLKKQPKDEDARLRLAAVYRKRKKYNDAIKVLKGVTKDNPKSLKAHLALVDIYERLNRKKDAAATYAAIARLAPDNKVVHFNQGVLYYENKQYNKATKAFLKVLKLDKNDIDAREYLFEVHRRRKKPREALAVLEELIRLRPSSWNYYPKAFALYNELKKYDRMTQTFARAVKQAPDRPKLRAYLGVSYERRGLKSEAIQQFEAAWQLDPQNDDYLRHLAVLYEETGKMEEALLAYQKILELEPDDAEAQESYLRLKMQEMGQ